MLYYLSEGSCQIVADMYPNKAEGTRRALEILYEKNPIQYLNRVKTHQKLSHLFVYEIASSKCFGSEMQFFSLL